MDYGIGRKYFKREQAIMPEVSHLTPCELPDGTFVVVFGQISSETPGSIFNTRFIRLNRAYLQA